MKQLVMLGFILSLLGCAKAVPVSEEFPEHFFLRKGKIVAKDRSNALKPYITVVGADPNSFTVLGPRLGKDKSALYFGYKKIEGPDYQTMRWENGYYKDKDRIYTGYYNLTAINNPDIDVASYGQHIWEFPKNQVTGYWAKDKNHYYFKNSTVAVDYNSFKQLGAFFFTDDDKVYAYKFRHAFVPLAAKTADFEALNEHYVFNDNMLYYNSKEVPEPVKFKTMEPKATALGLFWAKVDHQVLLHGKPFGIKNYDYHSFEAVGHDYYRGLRVYAKDKNQVYMNERLLPGADPAHFELLTIYSKDKQHVFYEDLPVKGADAATFEYLGWTFAKDKNQVYYEEKVLTGADPKSFRANPKDDTIYIDDNGNQWNLYGKKER